MNHETVTIKYHDDGIPLEARKGHYEFRFYNHGSEVTSQQKALVVEQLKTIPKDYLMSPDLEGTALYSPEIGLLGKIFKCTPRIH